MAALDFSFMGDCLLVRLAGSPHEMLLSIDIDALGVSLVGWAAIASVPDDVSPMVGLLPL